MNQRTENGFTFLDAAKSAVERFINNRMRTQHSRTPDRYLLVTCAENASAIKVGWKDGSLSSFIKSLKNLVANDLTDIGLALKRSFDLLNQYRLVNNRETYGHGRQPWKSEPAVIILISDACGLTSTAGNRIKFSLPMTPTLPGSNLTIEPFRWDQRLFTIQIQSPGFHGHGPVQVDPESTDLLVPKPPPLTPMCEVTGGGSYNVYDMPQLIGVIDNLATKFMSGGVIVNFIPSNSNSSIPKGDTTLLHVIPNNPNIGIWPIPEENPINFQMTSLPPRKAQPTITFQTTLTYIQLLEHFPIDFYQVEPGAFADYIVSVCNPPLRNVLLLSMNGAVSTEVEPGAFADDIVSVCNPPLRNVLLLSMNGAVSTETSTTFGFLTGVPNSNLAYCYVLPFNFQVLFQILTEYRDLCQKKILLSPQTWKSNFDSYLHSIPSYFIPPLKHGIQIWASICNIPPPQISETSDSGLNHVLQQYLQDIAQEAKADAEHRETTRIIDLENEQTNDSTTRFHSLHENEQNDLTFHEKSTIFDTSSSELFSATAPTQKKISSVNQIIETNVPTNVFDIPRWNLLDAIQLLRTKLFQKKNSQSLIHFKKQISVGGVIGVKGDDEHVGLGVSIRSRPADLLRNNPSLSLAAPRFNLPIAEMGNFQEFLNSKKKLRSVNPNEEEESRNHFGSPFRRKKSKKNPKFLNQLKFSSVDETEGSPLTNFQSIEADQDMPMLLETKTEETPPPSNSKKTLSRSASMHDLSSFSEPTIQITQVETEQVDKMVIEEIVPDKKEIEKETLNNNQQINQKEKSKLEIQKKGENQNQLRKSTELSIQEQWNKSHQIQISNQKIRIKIRKLIQQPGPRVSEIDSLISEVIGDLRFKTAFLNSVIAIAKLYKKEALVSHLATSKVKKTKITS